MSEEGVVEDYKLVSVLGQGASGQVYLAKKLSNNKLYALKFIDRFHRNPEEERQVKALLEQELNAIEKINSEFVVKSTDCFTTEDFFVIVMDYCSHGDLKGFVRNRGPLGEEQAVELFVQIISGIHAVHGQKIIHRDLKPDNIFLDEQNRIKIGDFGASIPCKTQLIIESICGTFYYMAPEMENLTKYDFAADLWSIACCFFFMLTGESPFSFCQSCLAISNTIKEFCFNKLDVDSLIERHMAKGTLKKGQFRNMSGQAKDLISKMLSIKPEERPTIVEILSHSLILKTAKKSKIVRDVISWAVNVEEHSLIEHKEKAKKHQFKEVDQSQILLKDFSLSRIDSLRNIPIDKHVDDGWEECLEKKLKEKQNNNKSSVELNSIFEEIQKGRNKQISNSSCSSNNSSNNNGNNQNNGNSACNSKSQRVLKISSLYVQPKGENSKQESPPSTCVSSPLQPQTSFRLSDKRKQDEIKKSQYETGVTTERLQSKNGFPSADEFDENQQTVDQKLQQYITPISMIDLKDKISRTPVHFNSKAKPNANRQLAVSCDFSSVAAAASLFDDRSSFFQINYQQNVAKQMMEIGKIQELS